MLYALSERLIKKAVGTNAVGQNVVRQNMGGQKPEK
jgi:hypothetical protein